MPVTCPIGNVLGNQVIINGIITGNRVFLYLAYKKGTEDYVELTFQVKERRFPDEAFNLRNESFSIIKIVLSSSDSSCYPLYVPKSADDLIVNFKFANVDKTDARLYPADGNTTIFSDVLNLYPKPTTITVTYNILGITQTVTDDGGGNIVDAYLSGTIDYNTGELNLVFNTPPDAGSNVEVNYAYANEGTLKILANKCSVYA